MTVLGAASKKTRDAETLALAGATALAGGYGVEGGGVNWAADAEDGTEALDVVACASTLALVPVAAPRDGIEAEVALEGSDGFTTKVTE